MDYERQLGCLSSSFSHMNKEIQGPVVDRVVESKEERIQDQARVLELQRELILKEDQDVKAVQNTVETEMKIYS